MLPRFILSRGGVPMLQLQRLLVAAPSRTSIRGARVLGGNNAIGRLPISPIAVRYGSSDAKDSKKGKRPRKKDLEKKKEDKDQDRKGWKAKKAEERSKKEKKEREVEGEVNVEGKTPRDTVGGDRKALAEGPAAVATGVSAPEVETPKEESTPVAGESSEPASAVAGSTAGPAGETTSDAPVPASPAGTTAPGAKGLEVAAAGPTTPGETSTTSSTAAELGPSSTFGEAIEIARNNPTEPILKYLEQEVILEEEPLKFESKSAEPEESRVEQESAVVNDANPPTPTSIMGEVTKEPRLAEPEAPEVEQESAVVNQPLAEAQPEVVKVAPEDGIELSPRGQKAVEKAGEPEVQPYTGPIDFYKLIASTPIPYANPHHLGRPTAPPPPKGASPPPPPSSPPSINPPPPKITEIHTSHSTPTAFPTTTTPNPQPITFASTRLNTSMASSEKSSSSKGTVIEGIQVPPKPEEPDNCCMSGCVNCVWDLYRESLEFYTAQKLLAQQALALLLKQQPSSTSPQNQSVATTMRGDNDDGVVGESEWLDNDDIPIGIRAFMATEKRLRERRRLREEREEGRG